MKSKQTLLLNKTHVGLAFIEGGSDIDVSLS